MASLNSHDIPAAGLAWRRFAALLALLAALHTPVRCAAADNLLPNGDLSQGAGTAPADWVQRTLYGRSGSNTTGFSWSHAPGAPAELRITEQANGLDRWIQALSLSAGWYLLSAEVRTEDLAPDTPTTAELGIDQSNQLWGVETDPQRYAQWTRTEVYFKVPASYPRVRIDCALKSPGRAFFRDLRLVRSDGPPSPASPQFNLDLLPCEMAIRWLPKRSRGSFLQLIEQRVAQARNSGQTFVRRIWTVEAVMALTLLIAIAGWLALGDGRVRPR